MNKIKELIDNGWQVDFRVCNSDGWYNVCAWHNSWGHTDIYRDNLTNALDKAYKYAKKLESGKEMKWSKPKGLEPVE